MQAPTLGAAITLLLEAKARANKRPRYLKGLRAYLLGLANELGPKRALQSVRPAELESFLFCSHPAASTAASNVGRLASLFSFGVRRGWLRSSPVAALDKITVEPSTPQIYRAQQVAAVMEAATRKRSTRRAVPGLALAFFGGIRAEEIMHLGWPDVHLAPGRSFVVVSHTKARDRRMAPLSENGAAWLDWSRSHEGELPPPRGNKATMRNLYRRAGVKRITNGARHTAATMMHARGDEPGRIARALGNSSRILFDHYVDALAVGPEEAAAFWSILPPAQQHQLMLDLATDSLNTHRGGGG